MAETELIYSDNPGAIPASYPFPPGLTAELQSVSARIDGSGAGESFYPCLSVFSQDGKLIARYPVTQAFAAGDSGEVTWGTFLGAGGSTTIINPATPGFTLDYAEAPDGIFPVTAITEASSDLWIQGNPVTFDGIQVAKVTVWVALGTTNRDLALTLFMDGVFQARIGQISPGNHAWAGSFIGIGHIVPPAGIHTFSIRAFTDAGASSTLLNPTPFPAVAFSPSFYEITASSPL